MTRKWIEVNDLSSDLYFANKNITFKTLMLRSDLCDYSDVYIVVYIVVQYIFYLLLKMKMIKQEKDVTFKNNALFRSYIFKINKTSIENAEEFYTIRV